jgi:hypothetical protein
VSFEKYFDAATDPEFEPYGGVGGCRHVSRT